MPEISKLPLCDFYGCPRPQHPEAEVSSSLFIPEWTPSRILKICLYHQAIIGDGPEAYQVGLTFRNELEIRPTPRKTPSL